MEVKCFKNLTSVLLYFFSIEMYRWFGTIGIMSDDSLNIVLGLGSRKAVFIPSKST